MPKNFHCSAEKWGGHGPLAPPGCVGPAVYYDPENAKAHLITALIAYKYEQNHSKKSDSSSLIIFCVTKLRFEMLLYRDFMKRCTEKQMGDG